METILITSRKDLDLVLNEVVESAMIRSIPNAIRRATTKPYLTKSDLMELTGWSSRQVEYKKSKREIPFIRRGRLVLFPTEEVFAYLDEGFVPSRKKL